MTDEDKKRQQKIDTDKLNRAETYLFCDTHNRHYPIGGQCPGCVTDAKKKR